MAPVLVPGPSARVLRTALAALALAGAAGCEGDPIQPVYAHPNTTMLEPLVLGRSDAIDILLAIDNSRSMADKQDLLARAVPELVAGLSTPPAGHALEPARNIHIGVISASLGGHGADACAATDAATRSNDDRAHLLARSAPDQDGDLRPATYEGKGFLAWDPAQKLAGDVGVPDPGDGEADLDADSPLDQNDTALLPVLSDMVRGVGQVGCGYESQLESWYRFLVDPDPYETITVTGGVATPEGVDTTLLQQRADFLRPGSRVVVLLLSDENDCSLREGGAFYLAAQQENEDGTDFHLPRPRSECATDPGDPCCVSCSQDPGSCPFDPTCYVGGDPSQGVARLTQIEDPINLRCFDQKRRFGVDFLYPIERYVAALTSLEIPNRAGELVPNPLFTDLRPDDDDSSVRVPGEVLLAGIVGVPWQDLARDPSDLTKGFKDAQDMIALLEDGIDTWDVVLGDPAGHIPPADPFMVESIDPRAGTNPITGDSIQPPGSATPNAINGAERTISWPDDLQYACVFDLPPGAERDCSVAGTVACDCYPGNDSPLCAPNPNDGGERTLQVKAKAYPSLRELAVLRALDNFGITASACPAQLDDDTRADYGYRPAMAAVLDRLVTNVDGGCFTRSLPQDAEGHVPCLVVEARKTTGACDCAANPGRRPVSPDHDALVTAIQARPEAEGRGWSCFCEVPQLAGESLAACQSDATEPVQPPGGGEIAQGWCYLDAASGLVSQEVFDAELASCPATEQRLVRFAGRGAPLPGATLFLACGEER